MNNGEDKKTLVVIIILLCLFLPAAVIGTIRHSKNGSGTASVGEENIGHNFIFKDKLYFYSNDQLLGTYDCSTCTPAPNTIDDNNYHTKYYKDGSAIVQPVINKEYAIFGENGRISLYSLTTSKVITTYEAIKTYGVYEKNGIMLIKNSGLWGTFNVNDISQNITFKYEYLACPGHLQDDKLDMSKLIALSGGKWKIISITDEELISPISDEIVDFNDSYYVTYKDNQYHIFDFTNKEYLEDLSAIDITIMDSYIFVLIKGKIIVYSSINDGPIKELDVDESVTNPTYKLNDSKYDIIVGEKVIESIELGSNI